MTKDKPDATVAQNEGADSTSVTAEQQRVAEPAPSGEQPKTQETTEPKSAQPGSRVAPVAPPGRAPQPAAGGSGGVSANNAPGGQGGGPRRGGRGLNVGMMVRNEQFQKELKLTGDQIKKLEAAMPQQGQGGGQQMSPEERQKLRAEIEAKVKAILKPEQQQRLRQIELQMQGPRALTQEPVAKELGLSSDQAKKIEAALQVQRPQGGGGAAGTGPRGGGGAPGAPGAGGPGGGFDREAFMKAREEANKKALAILTPAQQAQWEKMKGKPFVFQRPQGGPGGGAPRGGGASGGAGG